MPLCIRIIFVLSIFFIIPTIPSMAMGAKMLEIEKARVRMPPPFMRTAAAYLVLRNRSDRDVEVTHIETDAAEHTEFHTMTMDQGMMHMQKMEHVVVPAHGALYFEPGGNHLMLTGLKHPLNEGDTIHFTLRTADGLSLDFAAPVLDMRQHTPHQHSHGHH